MRIKKIFGLDVSDDSIEVVLLRKKISGKICVSSLGRIELDGGYIENGVIKKPKELADKIVTVLNEAKPKKITSKYCIVSVPDSQVFITSFKFPAGLSSGEIERTVPIKADDILPFKEQDTYYDYRISSKNKQTKEVMYVAVPANVIDAYVETLELAQLIPYAFDLESESLYRAAGSPKDSVLLDSGARVTNIYVYGAHCLLTKHQSEIAGNFLTSAVARSCRITKTKAEELKIKNGVEGKKQTKAAYNALIKSLEKLCKEINNLFVYYKKNYNQKLNILIITGGTASMRGMEAFLKKSFNLAVQTLRPFDTISLPKNLPAKEDMIYANAVGLALRGLRKNAVRSGINLLPAIPRNNFVAPSFSETSSWSRIFIELVIVIILAAAVKTVDFRILYNNFYLYFATPESNSKLLFDVNESLIFQPKPEAESNTEMSQEIEEQIKKTIRVKVLQNSLGYVNVRTGPGTNYEKIGQAPSGTEYELLFEQPEWQQILFENGVKGWVSSEYTEVLE